LLDRFRPRSARSADALILGALIVLVTVLYSVYALRIATFQNDEELYTRMARFIAANFPSGLWRSGIYTRGLQRLDPLALAPAFAILRGPGAYQVDHVLQCLLFASTSLPVFLLARRAGLGRAASHLAAVLSVIVPWAVVSTSFLSESLAYPVFAWVLYTAWLAACEPRLRNEALALLALVVAVFSRTALLALAPLLPLAAIWQTWRFELTSAGGPPARLRAMPARLWSRHRLLALLAIAALAAYLLSALGLLPAGIKSSLTGSYGLPHLEPLSSLYARDRYYISRAAAGSGYVTFGFALAWALVTLIRGRDAARHGLAVVCTLALLCVLLSLLQAAPDERYVVYAAVPVALAFAGALRDRVGLASVAGAVVTVLLIDSVTWPPLANLYDFFSYPAAIFYSRVLVNHVGVIGVAPERVVEIGILVVSIVWALSVRRARIAPAAAVVLALAVVALGATQTLYTLRKYSSGAGAGQPAAERSWVDRQVDGGTGVTALAVSFGVSIDYLAIWREAEFWNTSIRHTAYFGSPGYAPFPLGMVPVALTVQPHSGMLEAFEDGHSVTSPRLLLVPRVSTPTVGLDTESLSQDPALLLDLVHLRSPARLDWQLQAVNPEGFMTPGVPARANVFDTALRGESCATFALHGPPGFSGRWPYEVLERGRVMRTGDLASQQLVTITVPLLRQSNPHTPPASLRVKVKGKVRYPTGGFVSARVEGFAVGPCKAGQ
jgi:hypothetical protein